jgi:putative oxidoreductase
MLDEEYSPYAALLLRVSMGVLFILHGLYLKVFVFTMAGTAGYFESIGLPGALAWVTMLVETLGGIALILGLFVRPVSLVLALVLLGAAWFGHGGNGWVFSNPNGGWEYPVFWAIVCVALALMGPGAMAVGSSDDAKG